MLNIQSTPQTTSRSKILAVVLSLCAIAAVVVYTSTGKSTRATNFLSLPDEFVGEVTMSDKLQQGTVSGIFRKTTDSQGEWLVDAQLTSKGFTAGKEHKSVDTYTLFDGELSVSSVFQMVNRTQDANGIIQEETNVSCMNNDQFIPYGRIKSALENVYDFSSDELSADVNAQIDSHCPKGSSANIINFEDNFYTVCGDINGKHGVVKVIAEEWIGTVTLSNKAFTVAKPDLSCAKLDAMTIYDEVAEKSRTLTFQGDVESAWLFDTEGQRMLCRSLSEAGRNLCYGGPGNYTPPPPTRYPTQIGNRKCYMIHGLGKNWDHAWVFSSSAVSPYWDLSSDYTPGCSSWKFYKGDTNHSQWYDDDIAKFLTKGERCARGNSSNGNFTSTYYGTMTNAVIISHSMGNLMFASAQKLYCQRSSFNTKWVSQAGPFWGARSASGMLGICLFIKIPVNFFVNMIASIAMNAAGMCIFPIGAAQGFQGLFPTNTHLNGATPRSNNMIMTTNSKICGISPSSLHGVDHLVNWLIQTMSFLQDPNDGLVWRNSCQNGQTGFGSSWSNNNYNLKLGHGDCTGRHGNHWTANNKKGSKWMAMRSGGETGMPFGLVTNAPTMYSGWAGGGTGW